MSNYTKIAARFGIFLMVLAAAQPLPLLAQSSPLAPDQLSLIARRCSSAQISLEQLQKRDAVSRINRGRSYDQMMTQITAMNSRIAYNKINLPDLLSVASEMQTHIDRFRAVADKEYLEHINTAIKLDCKTRPAEFYALIEQIRNDRSRVVTEVAKLDELIARYREVLGGYLQTLPQKEQANAH